MFHKYAKKAEEQHKTKTLHDDQVVEDVICHHVQRLLTGHFCTKKEDIKKFLLDNKIFSEAAFIFASRGLTAESIESKFSCSCYDTVNGLFMVRCALYCQPFHFQVTGESYSPIYIAYLKDGKIIFDKKLN